MSKLNESIHPYFNNQVLKTLFHIKINTVMDFFQADCQKLINITCLSLSDIILIRDSILRNLCPKALTHEDHYRRLNCDFLKLNITRLDNLLTPGLPLGEIVEVCGLPGVGKTQFCFTVAINILQSCDASVLYIDTKGDFSATRIQQIIEMKGLSKEVIMEIMKNIHVVRIWNISDLILFLHQMKNGEILFKNLQIIIIDSLPAIIYQFHGNQNKQGLTMLNNFVNISRFICKEHGLIMLVVNLVTRWVELNSSVAEDADSVEDTREVNQTNIYQERQTRSLGRYWRYIPAIVLHLELEHLVLDSQNEVCIKASILKCPDQGKIGQSCTISLTSKVVLKISVNIQTDARRDFFKEYKVVNGMKKKVAILIMKFRIDSRQG